MLADTWTTLGLKATHQKFANFCRFIQLHVYIVYKLHIKLMTFFNDL